MVTLQEQEAAAKAGVIRGAVCGKCGHGQVTAAVVCLRCGSTDLKTKDFGLVGTVVSFTLVAVPPREFAAEAPYAFAVVELDGGARCAGRLPSVKDPRQLKVGQKVKFVGGGEKGFVFEPA